MVEIKERLAQPTIASTLPKPYKSKHRPKLRQRACKANVREKEIIKNAQPHDKRQ